MSVDDKTCATSATTASDVVMDRLESAAARSSAVACSAIVRSASVGGSSKARMMKLASRKAITIHPLEAPLGGCRARLVDLPLDILRRRPWQLFDRAQY